MVEPADPGPPDPGLPDTPRIRFRRLRSGDARLLDQLDRDPDVLRFIDWSPPSLAQQRDVVAGCLAEYRRWPRHGRFVAESPDGSFLGWFSLRVDADPAAPELGYRLRRQAWGRGLATEGARALVRHAFTELAAAEVHARPCSSTGRPAGCWPTAACVTSRPSSCASNGRCPAPTRARCGTGSPDRNGRCSTTGCDRAIPAHSIKRCARSS